MGWVWMQIWIGFLVFLACVYITVDIFIVLDMCQRQVIKIWMSSLCSCSVVGKHYVQWVMSTTMELYGVISMSNCVVRVYAIYFYSQVQSHLIKFLMLFVHRRSGRYYLKVKFTLMLFFHRQNGRYYLKSFFQNFPL